MEELAPRLLAHLGDRDAPPALEATLRDIVARARAAHPSVRLPAPEFMRHLAEKIAGTSDLEAAIAALRTDELYLACACAAGDATAIAAFTREYAREVDVAVAHLRADRKIAEDVRQKLWSRFFTGEGGARPRVADYAGRGQLRRWVRAAATRAAIDVLRTGKHEVLAGDERLLDRVLGDGDPELELMKRRYGEEFGLALREVVSNLDPATRSDLRMYYLEGLKLQELAALHRIDVSSMSRRLSKARDAVLTRTRSEMRARLQVGESEIETILRLIASRLDLTRGAFGS